MPASCVLYVPEAQGSYGMYAVPAQARCTYVCGAPPTGTVYDFVPLQPRATATLTKLLSGGAVDGEIRVLPARESTNSRAAADADDADEWRVVGHTALSAQAFEAKVRARAARPESVRLSLLGNNCFTFAASVLAAASPDSD